MKTLTLGLCAAALLALAPASQAQLLQVADLATLNPDDQVLWSQLGPAFTPVPDGTIVMSDDGNAVTLDAVGAMQRRDQNNGWSGNFGPGEELLWTAFNGPLDLLFGTPVGGFGYQIQADSFGAFTTTVEAFDAANNSLGLFNVNGNSNSNADDSAVFMGGTSVIPIARITISGANNDFAINTLSLVGGGGVAPVPEPGTVALLGGAVAFGGLALRRRVRK